MQPTGKDWIEDIRAAKELYYPQEVIDLLKLTSSSYERSKILINARRGYYDKRKGDK